MSVVVLVVLSGVFFFLYEKGNTDSDVGVMQELSNENISV
jgi:hypothetical protein